MTLPSVNMEMCWAKFKVIYIHPGYTRPTGYRLHTLETPRSRELEHAQRGLTEGKTHPEHGGTSHGPDPK